MTLIQLHRFNWDAVSLAHFRKYPNPYASHVLSSDIIERRIDSDGFLHTRRLLVKSGATFSLPSALASLVPRSRREAIIIEDSVIDPQLKLMQVSTRNISNKRILYVEEHLSIAMKSEKMTRIETRAKFHSQLTPAWSGISGRVESFCLKRFRDYYTPKSSLALLFVLNQK